MNNHSQSSKQSPTISSQVGKNSYPFLHSSLSEPIPSDENLMEALFVAGMPRTLVNRLASSFSRRLDD